MTLKTLPTPAARIGIPYALTLIDGDGASYKRCPVCAELIRLIEMKDFESYSGAEYAAHFAETHVLDEPTHPPTPASRAALRRVAAQARARAAREAATAACRATVARRQLADAEHAEETLLGTDA